MKQIDQQFRRALYFLLAIAIIGLVVIGYLFKKTSIVSLNNDTQVQHQLSAYQRLDHHSFSDDYAKMNIVGKLIANRRTPSELSTEEWNNVLEQIEAKKYEAYPDNNGFQSTNLNQGLQIAYQLDGTTQLTQQEGDAFKLNFQLRGVGYENLETLQQPKALISNEDVLENGSKVTYNWNDNITEWWINNAQGLEQWFSLKEAPAGKKGNAPLKLDVGIETDMQLSVYDDQITFRKACRHLSYSKFKAWDATGKDLPVHFEAATDKKGILLVIDDAQAKYPLTIDPAIFSDYIKSSNTETTDNFGYSVAISGTTMVVGAPFEDSNATGVNGNQTDNSKIDAGAAYVFTYNGTSWVQQVYLKASNSDAGDQFGYSVAISGNKIVIGALFEDSNGSGVNSASQANNAKNNAGAAYIFMYDGLSCVQIAYLKASNSGANDRFGSSVAIDGNTIVVGAPKEDCNATGVNGIQTDNSAAAAGAAYVFNNNGVVWYQSAYLKASNTEAGDNFSQSVAVSGNTIVVGASTEDSNAAGVNGNQSDNSSLNAGAAYVYTYDGSFWSQAAYLKASNADADDFFGFSVAASGNTIVVGAYGEASNATGVNGVQTDNSKPNAGAAYIFTNDGVSWTQSAYLKSCNSGQGDRFGSSVTVDGTTIVVGASREDSNGLGGKSNNAAAAAGAVYMFSYDGVSWSQTDYLKAPNAGAADNFGNSVAISGSIIVVGAPNEDSNATGINGNQADNSAVDAGAVYTFSVTVALPLVMGTIDNICDDGCQQLNWSTLSERDLKEFIIEGSTEGIHFEYLESVPAVGNSIQESFYSSSNFCSKAFNYFRISSKDIDGMETVQELVVAEHCLEGTSILVYPNPATDYVYVVLPEYLPIESVYLFSTDGKLLHSYPVKSTMKELAVPIQELAPGTYHFLIGDNTIPFIKTH